MAIIEEFESRKRSGMTTSFVDNEQTKIRIKIRIPKNYHEEPVKEGKGEGEGEGIPTSVSKRERGIKEFEQ